MSGRDTGGSGRTGDSGGKHLRPTPWRGAGRSDPTFYYDPAEREQTRTRVWDPPGGSFFRRNKGLTLTIIDVAVVVLLFAIVQFVIGPLQSRGRIDDYRLRADAAQVGETVAIAVTVTDPRIDETNSGTGGVVTIRVGDATVSDLLPSLEPTRTLRLQIPEDDLGDARRGNDVRIEVEIGEERETLRANLNG